MMYITSSMSDSMTKDTMIDKIFERFDGAFAENTIRAYRSDFEQYSKWCALKSIPPIPATADDLAMYVDELSHTCKSATIRRRVNSLGTILKLSKNTDPTKDPEVVLALKRMHRKIGRHQKQATPLSYDAVEKLLSLCTNDTRGLRNQVLLLLGYETMRRRSEICSYRFEDIQRSPILGNVIWLRKSKTDQFGEGQPIPVSNRLFDLIQQWRGVCPTDGPILRGVDKHGNVSAKLNPGSVGIIINGLNLKSAVSPQQSYSGHSFRVGKALDLFAAGKSIEQIMIKGGWQTIPSALTYLRSSID
jgi:integrase